MSGARRLDAEELAEVRRLIRPSERLPSLGQLMYWGYLVVLFGSFVVYAFVHASREQAAVGTQQPDEGAAAAVLATIGALVLLAGVRFGTWAGPVLLSRADATWLLSAPIERRRVVRPHLVGAVAVATVVGVVAALVSALAIAPDAASALWVVLAVNLVCWPLLAIAAVALSWMVESDHQLARRTVTWMPLLIGAVAVVCAIVWSGAGWLWTGPWGWFAIPVAAGSSGSYSWWPVAMFLLVAMAGSLAVGSWKRAAQVHAEELRSRAGSRTGLIASMALGDFRTIAVLRRGRITALSGIREVQLGLPTSRQLAIAWRDAVSLLRFRGRTTLAVITIAVGSGLLLGRWPTGWAASLIGTLAIYWGGAQLLEPMRLETDDPTASRSLPWTYAKVIAHHTIVPTTVTMSVAGTVFAARLTVTPDDLSLAGPPGLVLATTIAGLVIASAVISSIRGDPPIHLLAYGDSGLMAFLSWLFVGPLIVTSIAVPLTLLGGPAISNPPPAVTYTAATLTAIAVLVAIAYIRSKLRRQSS